MPDSVNRIPQSRATSRQQDGSQYDQTCSAQADEQRRVATNSQGNAARGKQLFTADSMKCATCHKVAGQGGAAGPDLSLVGGKLDKTHLIESLLDPSAQNARRLPNNDSQLEGRRSLSGIVVTENDEGLTLVDAANKSTLVPRRDMTSVLLRQCL